MNHLRYSGVSASEQQDALEHIIRTEAVLIDALTRLRDFGLPDAWLASGAIYNTVWNRLTGRPSLTGIKDFDIIYFDGSDPSYEAEDRVIARAAKVFADMAVPVELRNQARVHLWFPQRFGTEYPQLAHATQSLRYYASRTHAVAARLEADDSLTVEAPFGLEDMFAFRVTPNPVLENREAHDAKGARAASVWPEIEVVPW